MDTDILAATEDKWVSPWPLYWSQSQGCPPGGVGRVSAGTVRPGLPGKVVKGQFGGCSCKVAGGYFTNGGVLV